jgi:hypothetical protein
MVVGGVIAALAIWWSVFGTIPKGTMSGRRAAAAFTIEMILIMHSPFL